MSEDNYESAAGVSKSSIRSKLSLTVFVVVACVHFFTVISRVSDSYDVRNFSNFIYRSVRFALMAPQVIFSLFTGPLINSLFEYSPARNKVLEVLGHLISSSTYGMLGAFLVSKKKNLLIISLVGVCLFMFLGCCAGALVTME